MEEGERPMMNAFLLDAMKDACVMMDKTTVGDGMGVPSPGTPMLAFVLYVSRCIYDVVS